MELVEVGNKGGLVDVGGRKSEDITEMAVAVGA
jgi:hypothetical protein